MLMTFLGMKLKVTQNRRRKGRVCRMLPFPLCITVRRLVTIPTAWGNFAHAHIVITNWLIGVCTLLWAFKGKIPFCPLFYFLCGTYMYMYMYTPVKIKKKDKETCQTTINSITYMY